MVHDSGPQFCLIRSNKMEIYTPTDPDFRTELDHL